jgi:AcrR family transcriptional regulator
LYSIGVRDVKSPVGSLRAARAAETRQRIEEAARRCFAERGYAATTLREVAALAGVAVQTVYAAFGSKSAILRSLRLSVVDDPEADATWRAALEATTLEEAVEAFAHSIRLRWEHGADIVAINSDAARSDPAVRTDVDVAVGARRRGIGLLAARLVHLDPALGAADDIAASLEALTVTDAYAVGTQAYGWSADRYERWPRQAINASLSDAKRHAS